MAKKSWKLSMVLGSLLLAMACAKPPTQEMSDAENAVNGAIQAGAEQYATTELGAAQESLADAKAKMESKDYKGAKMASMDAKTKADAAQAAVEPNKKAMMASVQERMTALKPLITAAQGDASKVKGKAAETVKAAAAELSSLWTGIQSDSDAGNFAAAKTKLDTAQAKLDALKAAVAAAKTAPAKKK
jgi:hypothetical protein